VTFAAGRLEDTTPTGTALATTFHPRDGGTRVPLDVKAGDVILFGKYTSQEIKLDGEEFLIMREDEVLAVVETD
jgi:co-chaperonin GroES (HSP10)